MSDPLFSIIIPAYNGREYLGETIQSVLDQNYHHFELIVVDDASPDRLADVVEQFHDPRLRFMAHATNRGSDVARYTGLCASSGDIVTFLDQDDLFHPDKLKMHVDFLEQHPEVGVTYNPRFALNSPSKRIRDLYVPPVEITLANVVLGFPLSPSDVVFRRKWATEMDLTHGSLSWCGGETVHYGRLLLAGCRFARVDRALNYRRYHLGRIVRDLAGGCKSELYAQNEILSDPRCPPEVSALRDIAQANVFRVWAYYGLVQSEITLAHSFLREAIRLDPSIIVGKPCNLVNFLADASVDTGYENHESILRRIFAHLPQELGRFADQYDLAVGRGYLMKATSAMLWGAPEDARDSFKLASGLLTQIDESFLVHLTQQLLNYELEFGHAAALTKFRALAPYLQNIGGYKVVRLLKGGYEVNRAFRNYRRGQYRVVPKQVAGALWENPAYSLDRGVLSIFLRSAVHMIKSSAVESKHC